MGADDEVWTRTRKPFTILVADNEKPSAATWAGEAQTWARAFLG